MIGRFLLVIFLITAIIASVVVLTFLIAATIAAIEYFREKHQ